jgi:phosphotransferase system HPr-like phosphotransfer protein
MTVKDLHRKAMEFNDEAIIAKSKGEDPKSFYLSAYEFEKQAYILFSSKSNEEPTRSVLLRSAASLAMMAGLNVEAEKLIGLAISGNPPEEILEELRDLIIENTKFLDKTKLSPKEISKLNNPSSLQPGDTVTITFTGAVVMQNIVKNTKLRPGKFIIVSDNKDSSDIHLSLPSPSLNNFEILKTNTKIKILNQEVEDEGQYSIRASSSRSRNVARSSKTLKARHRSNSSAKNVQKRPRRK